MSVIGPTYKTQARLMLINNAAVTGAAKLWPGGKGSFCAIGTFGGASVILQHLGPDGVTWVSPAGATLAAADSFVFELPACDIRAAVSGGAPANLYVSAESIP